MSTAIAEEIELQDVGPIHQLSIPLPEGGGVVILRGKNDAGKSETLKAVDALVTGRGSIEKRDGSPRGSISLGEARLTVVKQQRRDGAELAAVSLDSRFDLADLVDPGLKDPEKADSFRIKALIQLTGVTPDITLFHTLAENKGEFDEIVRPECGECDDVVNMAAMIKRDFESAARKSDNQAENYQGVALGHREAALGYDESIESDSDTLQQALEAAIREEQRIETEQRSAAQQNEKIAQARKALEDARSSTDIPSLEAATAAEEQALTAKTQADEEVKLLIESLREARVRLAKAEAAHAAAVTSRQAAARHAATIEAWEQTASLQTVDVDPQAAQAARERVVQARQAVEQGALQRDKATRNAQADTADRMALQARKKAERMRDAAKGTEEILSSLVGKCGTSLRVERGRLVTNHARGTVPYSELSDGTRWKIAIDIGIEALSRIGVPTHKMILIIPQVAWSELSPANRKLIHEHARERGVHILTALATDDESVLAEPFAA